MTDESARALRGSPATWIVGAAIGLLFGLQVLWGGPGSEPLLARMGALHGPSVLEGQLWRLASGALLHTGAAHLATNLVVLIAVGRPVERLLGTARWLLLFVGSILGGSVASLIAAPELAVGASGGLLGLLAGAVVLAFTRSDGLPDRTRLLLRWGTLLALGVTVAQSFQPGVDMAAHLGGAVAGGLIVAAPPMRPPTLGAPPSEEQRIGAAFAAIVLTLAPLLGVFAGRGWAVMDPPTLSPRPFAEVTVPLPDLPPRGALRTTEGAVSGLFGGVEDTAIVSLAAVESRDPAAARQGVGELAIRWRDQSPESGFTPREAPRVTTDPTMVVAAFDGPDGQALEVAVVAVGARQVRIDVAPRPGHVRQWRGVAERMAAGVDPQAE